VRVARVPPDLGRLLRSLNALTPGDVTVCELVLADDTFDPRRHARSRVYDYRIFNAPTLSPFWRRYAWHCPQRLDVAAMNAAAASLVGEHDFTAFAAADPVPIRSAVRRVLESRLVVEEPLLRYRIEANSFLKHMVRNIVGTLVEIGSGNRPADALGALLDERDRRRAGATAPPQGLVLTAVRY
jgi:tRNA pseudouridine38-40 synthase